MTKKKCKADLAEILSAHRIDLPHKAPQSELRQFARDVFAPGFDDIERLLTAFDNSTIEFRNLAVPVDYFYGSDRFEKRNELYRKLALQYSVQAIEGCMEKAGAGFDEITDLIFVSTTGLSTPSIDAMIINELKLNRSINRYPLWGLGCSGGVSGISKAKTIADAKDDALVLLVCAELCSLTFIRNDISKSNFIASSLFSDGIAAVLISGADFKRSNNSQTRIRILDSGTKSFYDSLDVMGWEILDEGFKVKFSKDIPLFVTTNILPAVEEFLKRNNLQTDDIRNFVVHPGGIKVINAYCESLRIPGEMLTNTRNILREYGNMSSATVLYVLDRFIEEGFESGPGLMMSLGPGFSSDSVLLQIENEKNMK